MQYSYNSKMNIAIDASPISAKEGRGFRRHVLTLLQALACSAENHRFIILTDEPEFPQFLPDNDDRFCCEPVRRRLPFCYRRGTGWLGKFFLRRVDLVHFPCANIWTSPRGKAIVTLHDITPLHFPEKFFRTNLERASYEKTLKRIARNATKIITVSRHSQQDIIRYLDVPEEKVPVIYNFPDPRFLEPISSRLSEHLRIKVGDSYFLFVGGLDFRKNIPLLLEAFELYCEQGGVSSLVLAGRQNKNQPILYPPLAPLIEAHPFRSQIIWLTDVSDDELPLLYHNSTALVFPSSAEGFGYPLVEAMASGTAVITVDTSCLKEISGDAAFISELSPEGLASAMVKIETDSALRENLIELGLKRHALFNAQTFSSQLISTYKEIC